MTTFKLEHTMTKDIKEMAQTGRLTEYGTTLNKRFINNYKVRHNME